MKRRILSLLLAFTLFFSTLSAFVNPVYATNSLDIDEQVQISHTQPHLHGDTAPQCRSHSPTVTEKSTRKPAGAFPPP